MSNARSDSSAPRGWPVIFLAGPVVWYLYFWVVYLIAEAGCSEAFPDLAFLGASLVSIATIIATAVAGALIVYYMVKAYRQLDGPLTSSGDVARGSSFLVLGVILGFIFLVATFFVGLPALFLEVCG